MLHKNLGKNVFEMSFRNIFVNNNDIKDLYTANLCLKHKNKDNGIEAWLDVREINSSNALFGEITRGMNSARVVVACVSDEYTRSENCKLEFRFAHVSLKLPIVKAVVGLGNEWRNHEIAFLGGAYPEVNFQYDNSNAHRDLLEYVKSALEKSPPRHQAVSGQQQAESSDLEKKTVEETNAAYQELYELTQRKFLKLLIQFCEKSPDSTTKPCPRLFCIDFLEKSKLKVQI